MWISVILVTRALSDVVHTLDHSGATPRRRVWNTYVEDDVLSSSGARGPLHLHEAINGTTARRLYDAEHKVETARMYGGVHNYAYWFIDILIGTPPQRASVIADTGSTLCGFPCSGCNTCGHHIDQAFQWEKSTTFSWVKCAGRSCRCASDGTCSYYQSYTEGSSIGGKLFSDYVRIGDAIQHNPASLAEMGCHQKETKLFVSQKANGIMGLAVSSNKAKPSILQNLFRTTDASMFALCLAHEGGVLRVGGNQAFYAETTPGLQWIETGRMVGTYRAPLDAMSVDGTSYHQDGGFGRTIIDSGTTFTYFPSRIYQAVKRSLADFCKTHRLPCTYGHCFSMGENERRKFPTIKFTFGKHVVNWFPHSYLYPAGSTRKWCYGFEDNGHHAGSVLGATWMIDHEIVFDISKGRVGIADVTCQKYSSRPNPPTASDFATETMPPVPKPSTAPTQEPAKPLETQAGAHTAEKTHVPTVTQLVQPAKPVPKMPDTPKSHLKTHEKMPGKPASSHEPHGSTSPNRPIFEGLAGGYTMPAFASSAASVFSVLLFVLATLNLVRWWRRRRLTDGTISLEDWLERGEFPAEATNDGDSVLEADTGAGVGSDVLVLDGGDID